MPQDTVPTAAPETERLAADLLAAFETGRPVPPLTGRVDGLDLAGAYAIQRALVAGHLRAGRRVSGRKVGLTSAPMREQLGVDQPDFGVVLDSHTFPSGATVSIAAMTTLLPRIEGEIGFVLDRPLRGPGVTAADVRAATAHVLPVFELIDSRIEEWRIGLLDTVADNASALGAVLGDPVPLADVEPLAGLRMRLLRDDEVLQEGTGAAVLGDPAEAVAWLANALGAFGEELPAGEPILSGSLTAAVDLVPGRFVADFGEPFGSVSVTVEA